MGWSILLLLIVLGALARLVKPCLDDHGSFLQTRYWSNYLDVEQKLFDETCVLHARNFAKKCVVQFFQDVRDDEDMLRLPHPLSCPYRQEQWQEQQEREEQEEQEERLHGISRREQVDQLLNKWYHSKPELDVSRMVYRPRACVTWEDQQGKTLYSEV